MASAEIRDILIANQVVGKHKIHRLMGLCRQSDAIVCVDDPGNVTELGEGQPWYSTFNYGS